MCNGYPMVPSIPRVFDVDTPDILIHTMSWSQVFDMDILHCSLVLCVSVGDPQGFVIRTLCWPRVVSRVSRVSIWQILFFSSFNIFVCLVVVMMVMMMFLVYMVSL